VVSCTPYILGASVSASRVRTASNMVGIPNIRVERLRYEGETNHYWHMINCGDGWYHFDACIHLPEFFSFMLTDAEAEAYSRQKGKNAYYYRHDKEKYPATPEK
jgi:hypothetical protein